MVATSRASGRNMSRSGIFLAERNLPRAQGAHPQRCARNGAGHAPADNEQRNQNDEENLSQNSEKCLPPDEKNLVTDITYVVHYGQAAQYFILPANRQRENVNRHTSQAETNELSPRPCAMACVTGAGIAVSIFASSGVMATTAPCRS